ncbi:cytochrome c maturation protein CcmE [Azospirillum sp. YIM B02556]|uniref:Cytochrome c maturation protein CcmE n=1 Tax=Azospirillum endophyticum TaxID=2800326 RepID=A0ABS1F232_9PROT|nr:cytochrome c maturation protein CcmE [Azospirillum endophyticum]MBK1837473.1 cytochrome c maturation protein CcmE [Azospirillum endophyticum]
MLKSVTLAVLLTAALASSGTARADDRPRTPAFQPTSPQPIAEVVKAGGGTVTGTVETVAATWFVMTDGSDRIDIASRGFLPDGIRSGDQITVVGGIDQGALQADRIIRQDGTAFGRDTLRNHEGRRHGQARGHDGDRDDD